MEEPNGECAEIDPLAVEVVVAQTWDTYLGATAIPIAAGTSPTTDGEGGRVEARIRMTGDVLWEMALCGSWRAAEDATRRMLQSSGHIEEGSAAESVLDAWGELVNTLAGNLKASLQFGTYTLSMPQVFMEQTDPEATAQGSHYWFEWDGHLAMIRIRKITCS